MENGLLLPLNHHQVISSSIFLRHQLHFSHLRFTPFHFSSFPHHHNQNQILRYSLIASSSRKWDSNAETFRSKKFKFKFNPKDDDEEEEELDDGFPVNFRKKRKWYAEILEEITEGVWIIKVFKSFGLFLPFIIISFLLATGPKAFLMALAPSLAISILSLAFERIWGKTRQRKPKRKARMKKKTTVKNASSYRMEEEQKDRRETGNGRRVNQYQVGSDNGTVYKVNQDEPGFGGWDDFDEQEFIRVTSGARRGSKREQTVKLSGIEERREAPLLVRLLIALFPFIGSWAEMFW